jgi:RNA polymerase sigma-70 factor, ECF subfamily
MHTLSDTNLQGTAPRRHTMASPHELTLEHGDLDTMYRREYPGLVAVATALSGYDGEDLVQDTMLKALIHWNRVERLERPGGWCHRVLVNLCHGRWRRRVTEARYLSRLRRSEPITAGPTPDVMAFWTAVRALPERPRSVVALYYAGDRTVAEVAGILGVPEGTVRSDLTRARAALSTQLED